MTVLDRLADSAMGPVLGPGLGSGRRSGTLTLSDVTEVPPPVAEDRSAEADEFVTCAGSSPA